VLHDVGSTIIQFSTNGSPKYLVFGDVKMLRKFEGCHPQQKQFSTGTSIPGSEKPYTIAVAVAAARQQQAIIRMMT